MSSEKPFSQRWLNNAYQDSLQPTSQWQRASHLLAERLANSIEAEPAFSQSERFKQMTFQLLGEVFVRTYFPHDSIDPAVITQPNIAYEERRNLEADCRTWLDAKLQSSAESLPNEASLALELFKAECGQLVVFGLDKELYRRQVNFMRDPEKAAATWAAPASARQPVTAGGSSKDDSVSAEETTRPKRGPHEPYDAQPPLYSSFHSEHCAESLVALLRSNPDRLPEIYARLRGRRLPQALRKFVWRESLFKAERKRSGQWNVERFFRERFGKTVARGVGELKIKRATQSPINSLLENAVIETYEKTSSTKELNNPMFLTEAVRVLNVLYVYDRSYEPFLILWLVPLQVAFREEAGFNDMGEQVYELAMLLSLLHQGTYPAWPTVFAIAERSLELVQEADPEFHGHLIEIATRNIDANLKDFMVQVIHEEFERAQSLLKTHSDSPRQQRMSKNVLVNPAIFLRKWIGEGFVGVLGLQATLFYWDQCFLTDFASATIEDAALVVLFLLRDQFMTATDYPQMKNVFLTGPRLLYTADVIRAWCHLQDRGDPALIPSMNRHRLEELPLVPTGGSPTPIVPSTPLQPMPLPGLLVDQVTVRLQLMKDGPRQKLLASSFSEKHLLVKIQQRYGSVNLKTAQLTQDSAPQPIEERNDFRSFQIAYADRCEYPRVDLAQYDLESHLGTVPYLLVQVQYASPNSDPIMLGWARVMPYQRLQNGQFTQPNRFRDVYTIYPGLLPEDPANWQPGDLPDFDEDDPLERQQSLEYRDSLVNAFIGDFSELSLHGYPLGERPSPEPIIAPEPPPPEPVAEKPEEPPPPQPQEQPKPPPPKLKEPKAVVQPKGIPKRHWTIHAPASKTTYPAATGTNQPFDVYIDQVRYMLDGITIVKVTGRFLNTGRDTEIPDLLLIPNPKVSPRNLTFFPTQRIQVKASDAMNLQSSSVLMIRVYTLVKPTLDLVVVGTCVLKLFDDQGRLLTGGHQKRLREHANMVASNAANLTVNLDAIQQTPSLPCVTVLFRVLPTLPRVTDPPEYISGYYRSKECYPTEFELKVFREHDRYETYPETFDSLVNFVQQKDGARQPASEYNQFITFVPLRMDPVKCLPANMPPAAMPPERYFHYRPLSGANLRLEQAFGLTASTGTTAAGSAEGLIFAVTSTVIGQALMDGVPSKLLGIGYDTQAVSIPNAGSQLTCPQFENPAVLFTPRSDPVNCFLVQFFRLPPNALFHDAKFWIGQTELTELKKEHFIAWAVCPLLEYEFTFNGRHRVPVFMQSAFPLTFNRIRAFRQKGFVNALKVEPQLQGYVATASALLSLVDGHLSYKVAPQNAPVHTTVYDLLPKTTQPDYQKSVDSAGGTLVKAIIASTETEAKFLKDGQVALETLVNAVPRKQYEPLFIAG